jgi:hypothetical protein
LPVSTTGNTNKAVVRSAVAVFRRTRIVVATLAALTTMTTMMIATATRIPTRRRANIAASVSTHVLRAVIEKRIQPTATAVISRITSITHSISSPSCVFEITLILYTM